MQWFTFKTLGFTLSDGQTCKAGTQNECNKSHTFDTSKKITWVECIIWRDEWTILQINFYHYQQRLVQVGIPDDNFVKISNGAGRIEVFEIADDE